MSVYVLDTQNSDIPIYNPNNPEHDYAWLLRYMARLERRFELGKYLSDDALAWLTRAKFPDRAAFWFECLAMADLDGVVCFRELQAWSRFETGRKQRYLVQGLIEHGLVKRLDDRRLQVLS